jgi:hypothetical protein
MQTNFVFLNRIAYIEEGFVPFRKRNMFEMIDPSEGYNEKVGYTEYTFACEVPRYSYFRSKYLGGEELASSAKPSLREPFIVLEYPYDLLLTRNGLRPPTTGDVMVPIFVQEVREWCRDQLKGPVEIVEFVVEVPLPADGQTYENEAVPLRGYAAEFSRVADAVYFKLRWG